MRAEDLRAFARRPWNEAEALDAACWRGPGEPSQARARASTRALRSTASPP